MEHRTIELVVGFTSKQIAEGIASGKVGSFYRVKHTCGNDVYFLIGIEDYNYSCPHCMGTGRNHPHERKYTAAVKMCCKTCERFDGSFASGYPYINNGAEVYGVCVSNQAEIATDIEETGCSDWAQRKEP